MLEYKHMNILETLKGLFGSKGVPATGDVMNNVTSTVTAQVSDMAATAVDSVINFDDINVSNITSVADKFGIMDKLPEAEKVTTVTDVHTCEEGCTH